MQSGSKIWTRCHHHHHRVGAPRRCASSAPGWRGWRRRAELRREGLDVTVLEQSADVGGQWLYDAATDGRDPLGMAGVHSSIYSSLRLNSPREVCGFSDFPFRPTNGGGGDARRYPVHGELLRYIREFCDVFGLMDAVRLDTTVVRVAMAPPRRDGSLRWTVRSKHNGDAETEEVFDAVVVATGQYSQPRLPSIDGMDKWRRRQLHSHSYRVPDSFAGEVVVIVGCNLSGKEVALELLRVAKEVHLSSKSTKEAMTPSMSKMLARYDNLHLQPLVEHLCEDGRVVFDDGSFVVADAVIYGGEGHRRRQPRRAAVRARVPTGARAVALLRGHPGQGDPAAVRRGAGEVGGAGAVRGGGRCRRRGRCCAPSRSTTAAKEAAGLPKRQTHDLFLDLEYCDEYGERHCGFPRTEQWKKELIWSSISDMCDDIENFRDDYHDSDIVRDGRRLHGWASSPPLAPRPQEKDDDHDKEEDKHLGFGPSKFSLR
ncbi:hypothetical protein OsJ_01781 [Oryza sativa Japonica Group]|uniref:Flavin-containing monooxygenase n=1 Tax=Oryza sativa subsp. japonica TaxID=39947 RepID=B9EWS2_ORYSJ|nr:hypothetical protein OsJ_01781 [Oryza sativa Japonica Group]